MTLEQLSADYDYYFERAEKANRPPLPFWEWVSRFYPASASHPSERNTINQHKGA